MLILIVYWRDLSILVNEAFNNEAVSHNILVPFLISYIVYKKRYTLKATFEFESLRQPSRNTYLTEIAGLSFCLTAFLIYWYGSATFYPLEYHLLSLPVFLIGILLILFNVKTVIALIVPILFLLFLVPLPSEITYSAGALLGNFNTQASYTLLNTLSLPVALQSTYGPPTITVNTPSGTPMLFSIDLACSGLYSLIAFIMFAAFLVYITQGSFLKKAAVFLIGFILLQILNVIRISTIVSVGYWFGQEIAMTLFHVAAGWVLLFGGILLLLLISEKLLHLQIFRASNEIQSCSRCDIGIQKQASFCSYCGKFLRNLDFPTKVSGKFWVKVTALLIGLFILASSMQAPVFAFAQGLTFTNPSLNESTEAFPEFEGYQLRFLDRDEDYEKIANQDASLIYGYMPLNYSNPLVYVDIGIANSITKLHNWETCYVSWQTVQGQYPIVAVLDSRDVQIVENPPIIAHYFVFESPNNYTQVTLYWYEEGLFNTGITIEKRFVRISLIIITTNQSAYPLLEETLLQFALPIAAFWEPLKTQSIFSLSLPLQQILLVLSILVIISTAITQYMTKWRKKMGNLKIFGKFGPPNEKMLYQTIKNVNDGVGATTEEIAHALEQATGKSPEADELSHMLNYLQENRLVELDLASRNDVPQLVWKP